MTSLHLPQNILLHVQNHLGYHYCLWLYLCSLHAVRPSFITVQNMIYTSHTDIVHLHSTLHYTNTVFYTLLLLYFNFACIPLIECEYRITHMQQSHFWQYYALFHMTMLQDSESCIYPCTHLSKKSAANNGFIAIATTIGNEYFWLDCFPVTMAWLDLHYEVSNLVQVSTSNYFCCFMELHITVCTQCLQKCIIKTKESFNQTS
jgi:hypothetical protein